MYQQEYSFNKMIDVMSMLMIKVNKRRDIEMQMEISSRVQLTEQTNLHQ